MDTKVWPQQYFKIQQDPWFITEFMDFCALNLIQVLLDCLWAQSAFADTTICHQVAVGPVFTCVGAVNLVGVYDVITEQHTQTTTVRFGSVQSGRWWGFLSSLVHIFGVAVVGDLQPSLFDPFERFSRGNMLSHWLWQIHTWFKRTCRFISAVRCLSRICYICFMISS